MFFICGFQTAVFSQNVNIPSVDRVANFQAIPNDPVFQLLGLPGQEVSQPGTIREFLASINSFSDINGNLKLCYAMSFTPIQLILGNKLLLRDYVDNFGTRLLSNISISLGSAPSLNEDSTTNWGLSLRIPFLNSGDGRLDPKNIDSLFGEIELIAALRDAIIVPDKQYIVEEYLKKSLQEYQNLCMDLQNTSKTSDKDSILKLIELKQNSIKVDVDIDINVSDQNKSLIKSYLVEQKVKSSLKSNIYSPSWNTNSLELLFGVVYNATQKKLFDSKYDKSQAWLNGSFKICDSWQLVGQFGYYNVIDIDSSHIVGALMVRTGNENFRFGLGSNIDWDNKAENNKHDVTIKMAFEYKVSSDIWFVASLNHFIKSYDKPQLIPNIGIKTSSGFFKI